MVIIVPVALGQSEAGGVRAGHSLLLSQARAEQLLFPAAALLHYNNPISSLSNSLLILPVLSCQLVKAPAVSPSPLRAFSILAISLHHHFRSLKVPHHVADPARSVHRRR